MFVIYWCVKKDKILKLRRLQNTYNVITFIKKYIYVCEDFLPKGFMAMIENLENREQKNNSCIPINQRLLLNICVGISNFFYLHVYVLPINTIVKNLIFCLVISLALINI